MPIINFTTGDMLATLTAEAKWYAARITEIEGPTTSKSGKSVTYFVTFTIEEPGNKFNGKELKVAYNTESSSHSVLGVNQYEPASKLTGVYSAAMDIPLKVEGMSFDTDELKNKAIDINVAVEPSQNGGDLVNTVIGYAAYGKVSKAAAAF